MPNTCELHGFMGYYDEPCKQCEAERKEARQCFSCVTPEACQKEGCRFFEGPMITPGS
jgi:hypothetical protein